MSVQVQTTLQMQTPKSCLQEKTATAPQCFLFTVDWEKHNFKSRFGWIISCPLESKIFNIDVLCEHIAV